MLHYSMPCNFEKNKVLGVLVRMVKIMKVWRSYEIKRCNKSFRGEGGA